MSHATRACPSCSGAGGTYVNESREAGNGQTVDSKVWKGCGTCNGRGTV